MLFRLPWNLSTTPLLCGQYTLVLVWEIPFSWQKEVNSFHTNCGPLSETIVPGKPFLLKISINSLTTILAVVFFRVTASGHLDARSIDVRRYSIYRG